MIATEENIADFVVTAWGAFAPGLSCCEDWQRWRLGEVATGDQEPPPPKLIPRALLRRLSPLAKAVFNAIVPCAQTGAAIPAVFSSSHGEIVKSLQMLEALQSGDELSPTAFSLSVHNAIAGLFSIAFGDHQEISVVAPGNDGMASGFIEALGLLHEGHSEVLLVFYDEPLPEFYPVEPFKMDGAFVCALALKLALTGGGMRLRFQRRFSERYDGEQPLQLPAFIDFLLSEQRDFCLGNACHSWRWLKIL